MAVARDRDVEQQDEREAPPVPTPAPAIPAAAPGGPMNASRVMALQRSVGNAATAAIIARDQPAAAPAAPTTEPVNDAHFHGMISDRMLAISNLFQSIFERQKTAVEDLAKDLTKPDEPSLSEQILRAAVEAALNKGITAVMDKIATGIVDVGGKVMADRAIAGYTGYVPMGLTAADLVAADVAAAKARATSAVAIANKWATGKVTGAVPKALDAISKSLPPSEQFIQGQKNTLQDTKDNSQRGLLPIADGLRQGGQKESLLACGAMLEALDAAKNDATALQYLKSLGEWAGLMHGSEYVQDPTANFIGVLRLTIADDVKKPPQIKEARITGMDTDALNRIKTTPTLSGRRLSDFPIQIVVQTNGLFVYKKPAAPVDQDSIRSGSQWLKAWAQHNKGADPQIPDFVAAALLFIDLESKTFAELGDIKHGTGLGLFSD